MGTHLELIVREPAHALDVRDGEVVILGQHWRTGVEGRDAGEPSGSPCQSLICIQGRRGSGVRIWLHPHPYRFGLAKRDE